MGQGPAERQSGVQSQAHERVLSQAHRQVHKRVQNQVHKQVLRLVHRQVVKLGTILLLTHVTRSVVSAVSVAQGVTVLKA